MSEGLTGLRAMFLLLSLLVGCYLIYLYLILVADFILIRNTLLYSTLASYIRLLIVFIILEFILPNVKLLNVKSIYFPELETFTGFGKTIFLNMFVVTKIVNSSYELMTNKPNKVLRRNFRYIIPLSLLLVYPYIIVSLIVTNNLTINFVSFLEIYALSIIYILLYLVASFESNLIEIVLTFFHSFKIFITTEDIKRRIIVLYDSLKLNILPEVKFFLSIFILSFILSILSYINFNSYHIKGQRIEYDLLKNKETNPNIIIAWSLFSPSSYLNQFITLIQKRIVLFYNFYYNVTIELLLIYVLVLLYQLFECNWVVYKDEIDNMINNDFQKVNLFQEIAKSAILSTLCYALLYFDSFDFLFKILVLLTAFAEMVIFHLEIFLLVFFNIKR